MRDRWKDAQKASTDEWEGSKLCAANVKALYTGRDPWPQGASLMWGEGIRTERLKIDMTFPCDGSSEAFKFGRGYPHQCLTLGK
jgi:hypothetical protein